MFYFDVVKENHIDGDLGNYESFGIAVFKIIDGAKEKLCQIEDVFLNESKAIEFTQVCNDFQLSPVHIYDVVLDAIS